MLTSSSFALVCSGRRKLTKQISPYFVLEYWFRASIHQHLDEVPLMNIVLIGLNQVAAVVFISILLFILFYKDFHLLYFIIYSFSNPLCRILLRHWKIKDTQFDNLLWLEFLEVQQVEILKKSLTCNIRPPAQSLPTPGPVTQWEVSANVSDSWWD